MKIEKKISRNTIRTALFVCTFFALQLPVFAGITLPEEQHEGDHLYRFSMLQAGPGQLMQLIDTLKKNMDSLVSKGTERPYLVQHHQGDHWDLLVIYPLGQKGLLNLSPERAKLENETLTKIRPLLAWHEDLYVTGPSPKILAKFLAGQGLVHFEMMQALAGKYEALVEERRMENRYNVMRGRGHTLIFTHVAGAAWDVVTLGAYKDWHEYASSDKIPSDLSEKSAKKAGFPSAREVGAYMRRFISIHMDTLGPVIY